MFTVRVGTPSLAAIMLTSDDIIGSEPSRSTLPSSRTRRSASRIGPMFQSVTATNRTRKMARIA